MAFFTSKRFLPLFTTQFLGAFNDNLLKNALVMLITYKLATEENGSQLLVTAAAAIFILPYFLFSATAGQVSDKIERGKVTRIIKLVEIIIMIAASIGFYLSSVWFLMFVLFMMGVHSTFFGPIKFALLPQHLRDDELLLGNAYIEAGSFLAILLGTILGGVLVLEKQGAFLVSAALLLVAIFGYISSLYIPNAPAPEPDIVIGKNIWKETWKIVDFSRENKRVFRCIIGISWFWLVGATYLSQFPPYVKDILFAESSVVTLFLTIFSVGIGIGSLLCNKLLKGEIKSTYVPVAMLGMTIFGIDLYFASMHDITSTTLISLKEFVSSLPRLRILFDLLLIAISAGIYIVPLYAIMQHDSDVSHRARIIAANNVMNAIFMVAAALITLVMLASHFTIPQVFLFMAIGNGLVGIYIWKTLNK
jgi:acyl-[acyl-carrier-protein]-phospholipid O-acyltransferase / long-chain-fatty-acid--[acyl-carrier-protein] ligase